MQNTKNDQKRIMKPNEAFAAGSDWLVIGRSITKGDIKKNFNKEIITPGIRISSKADDQKRVTTPREAFKQGSDWIVIGRDLTKGNIKQNFKKLSDHLS